METRNTKQKEIILEVLKDQNNMFHPTAQDIVKIVLDKYPTIGQSTVYRNINKLVNEGTLIKIPTNDNIIYDINNHSHAHFCCKKCGKVIDLFDKDYQENLNMIENKYKIKIDDSNLIYNGLCEECNDKI